MSTLQTENQKLLELLAPYRDKSLTFGCKVATKYNTTVRWTYIKTVGEYIYCLETSDSRMPKENVVVVGHPPTLNIVLIALNDLKPVPRMYVYDGKLHIADDFNPELPPSYVPLPLTQSPSEYDELTSQKLVKLLEQQ